MLKAATIVLLLLLLLLACKNAQRGNDTKASRPVNTAHLKNTPLPVDASLLEEAPKTVQAFYAANGNTTLWTEKADRLALQEAIEDIATDGLMPSDYNIAFLKKFEALTAISEEECMRYDILMTQSFAKLVSHLFKGKLKPSGVYYDWALSPKKIDVNTLLTEALKNHNIKEIADRCRPRHAIYGSLRESLAYLNNLPDDKDIPKIKITKPVTRNDSTSTVSIIKQRLAYWGDLDIANSAGNIYDKETAKAVKKFQERHGIVADGSVNSRTADALNFSRNARREQVVANLERWRWFPYDFGEKAIVVNIPNYRLAVLENNKDTVATYNVVVGKADRRSPVLHSVLSNLVLNPTWTVPPTYLKKDLTPAAIKDTAHFAHLNMKIYRGDKEIPVAEWDSLKPDHYVYVQSPGNHNSLGQIKFNFRNGFSVYLHDTNHREYFKKPYRALSSGCVRVQDPLKLAGYVLDKEDAGWTKEKLDELLATTDTQSVGLKKTTHVHQLYWTAWMDKGGLQFRNDIYSLDKILYDKLRSQR